MTWTKTDGFMDGSSRRGTLVATPVELRSRLGEPSWVDTGDGDGKVDCEWVFQNERGDRVSVYAYKATSLYEDDLPASAEFWASAEPVGFSVGGYSVEAASAFIYWFKQLTRGYR